MTTPEKGSERLEVDQKILAAVAASLGGKKPDGDGDQILEPEADIGASYTPPAIDDGS